MNIEPIYTRNTGRPIDRMHFMLSLLHGSKLDTRHVALSTGSSKSTAPIEIPQTTARHRHSEVDAFDSHDSAAPVETDAISAATRIARSIWVMEVTIQ